MISSTLLHSLTSALFLFSQMPTSHGVTPSFPYGSQKVRGVNLGGWLVLEPWITPSLFDNTGDSRIVDEWTFGQFQDRNTATNALRHHWDTWITEKDFEEIAAAGLNHIRLPIGYWAFDVGPDEPFISGQIPYMEKAVTWARNHNLKLIIDLHGAPGSQNGFDNSGQKMNYPMWHTNQTNIDRTNRIIETIADMYKDQTDAVAAIAPLNEPAGYRGDDVVRAVRQYWLDSYENIRYPYRSSKQSNTVEVIHDAFKPLDSWNNWQQPPDFQGVVMDTHIYQIFSDDQVSMSQSEHIQSACNRQKSLAEFGLWVIVGEWSPARTDCAKYLNGRGVGSRYDGTFPGSPRHGSCNGLTGKASSFSPSYKTFLRQFWEAQVISYEKGEGWIQWAWKAEMADEWSYQAGLTHGWIPRNPTQLQYPNICD